MTSEDLFNQIDFQYSQSLPFVVYRKPNSLEVIALLQHDETIYKTENFTESGFVLAPFDDKENTVLIPLEHSEMISVISDKVEFPEFDKRTQVSNDEKERTFHINLVKKGIELINKGNFKKVVLSRSETVELSEVNLIDLFKNLLSHYPTAFVYCFYHPKVGTWLGATPETLLKIEGHQFFTTALAGTQKFEGDLSVDWSPKEKDEQNIVTNYIVDNLKTILQNIKVESVETIKAGSLLHLKSNISGTLDFGKINLKKMLNTLHPTPAVCGFPKQQAKQFILVHELYHREFYTGFLGELNFKEKKIRNANRRNVENNAYSTITTCSNLFVNLRCMQLKSNEAIIYVGGGITKDSNPESEWQETVNKTQTIKSIL